MRQKILVADDSNTIRSVAESLLKQEGYEVFSAAEGAKALSLIKTVEPDLIILDSLMPGLDGLQVCQELKKEGKYRDIPILIFLSSAEYKIQEEFQELGVSGFVLKPFSPREFLDKVEEVLKEEKTTPTSGGSLETVSLNSEELEKQEKKFEKTAHDFNWFIQEMKKEVKSSETSPQGKLETDKVPLEKTEALDEDFKIDERGTSKIGYERFISEFKKEMEQVEIETPEGFGETKPKLEKKPSKNQVAQKELDYSKVTDKFIQAFSFHLAQEIAKKLDKKLIEELVREKLKEFTP